MKRFWSWLAVWCGKNAGLVAVIGLLLTLTMGVGMTRLRFVTSQSSYLNTSDKIYQDDLQYETLFGGQAMVVMITMDKGHTIDEFFTPANDRTLKALTAELDRGAKANGIRNTIDPLMTLDFSNALTSSKWVPATPGVPAHAEPALTPDGKPDITSSVAGKALLRAMAADPTASGKKARSTDTTATLGRVAKITGPHDTTNPAWIRFLLYNNSRTPTIRKALRTFFPDARHAQVIVRLDGNQALDQQSASATYVTKVASKYHFDGASTLTTGAPALLKSINAYLKGGMLLLGGIAALVMIVILLVLFDVRWRLLPLGVITIGLIWAFGTAGFLGIPLTLATIAGLPVMLGVGIDYAIQMHARVEEEAVLSRSEHPIQETARNLCPRCSSSPSTRCSPSRRCASPRCR